MISGGWSRPVTEALSVSPLLGPPVLRNRQARRHFRLLSGRMMEIHGHSDRFLGRYAAELSARRNSPQHSASGASVSSVGMVVPGHHHRAAAQSRRHWRSRRAAVGWPRRIPTSRLRLRLVQVKFSDPKKASVRPAINLACR